MKNLVTSVNDRIRHLALNRGHAYRRATNGFYKNTPDGINNRTQAVQRERKRARAFRKLEAVLGTCSAQKRGRTRKVSHTVELLKLEAELRAVALAVVEDTSGEALVPFPELANESAGNDPPPDEAD